MVLVAVGCGPQVQVGDGTGGNTDSDGTEGNTLGSTVGSTVGGDPSTTVGSSTVATATSVPPNPSSPDTGNDSLDTVDDTIDTIDTCAFLCEPDGGDTLIECDVWAQDCPFGEKCVPWAADGGDDWNGARCSPLDPSPDQPGDVCQVEGSGFSGIDTCALGSFCVGVDPDTNLGSCAPQCQGSVVAPVCPEGSACFENIYGVFTVCLQACDPLQQDCPAAFDCVPAEASQSFVCHPTRPRTGGYGQGCSETTDCAEGSFCVDGSEVPDCVDAACCTTFCDADAPMGDQQCAGFDLGQVCKPWLEIAGWDAAVGGCGVP
ncbi:MAG: hypothetical protein IPH07_22450 [Deltaproteobacteria bacterium]|nr:hypothetical protein [Deltaproteobacteria bacterium]MBK8714263.1 hypothetical protein [Deltaproteobacteria bacterium]MBP7285947.1 hypothetical protein [Nannocystaceae bacterium]